MDPDQLPSKDEISEAEHFCDIYEALAGYGKHSIVQQERHRLALAQIPTAHSEVLAGLQSVNNKLAGARAAILANHRFLRQHILSRRESGQSSSSGVTPQNMDKVRSTIKSCMRDWSSTGAEEREQCYGPILRALEKHFPEPQQRQGKRVLVPGSGLGRLAWEICNMGFSAQGNEFSYFMLLTSNFLLNMSKSVGQFEIYPFVHQSMNQLSASQQLLPVQVPDVLPGSLPPNSDFSMVAGEFLEVYDTPTYHGQWDAVTTAFFIDTAHNILEYLEAIHRLLVPGGLWVNLGPLLYHYSDMQGELSLELTYEELRECILHYGFEILHEEFDLPCGYCVNSKSFMQVQYKCVHFICRKK